MTFHSDLFGWDYVWRHFADAKGGQAIEHSEGAGLGGLTLPHSEAAPAMLITPFVHHGKKKSKGTTVVTYFQGGDEFKFSIQTEKLTDQVGKAFGMQDVQIQDAAFDSKFLIQGNDEARIQRLFENPTLRDALLFQSPSQMRIETDPAHFDPEWNVPHGYSVLVSRYDHLFGKIDELETAMSVIATTVEQLAVLGAVRGRTAMRVNQPQEVAEQPKTQSHKLHSPLLDPS